MRKPFRHFLVAMAAIMAVTVLPASLSGADDQLDELAVSAVSQPPAVEPGQDFNVFGTATNKSLGIVNLQVTVSADNAASMGTPTSRTAGATCSKSGATSAECTLLLAPPGTSVTIDVPITSKNNGATVQSTTCAVAALLPADECTTIPTSSTDNAGILEPGECMTFNAHSVCVPSTAAEGIIVEALGAAEAIAGLDEGVHIGIDESNPNYNNDNPLTANIATLAFDGDPCAGLSSKCTGLKWRSGPEDPIKDMEFCPGAAYPNKSGTGVADPEKCNNGQQSGPKGIRQYDVRFIGDPDIWQLLGGGK